MSKKSIKLKSFTWCWKEYGHGKKLMLAFHGFNRSPEDYQPFGKSLGTEYTIIALDLFFHGSSFVEFDEEPPALSKDDLKELIDAILKQYNAAEFEVIAYSFGGRLALNCVEIYKSRVKGLYLMAPDAMRFNPGYFFAVQTSIGRAIFKKYLKDPSLLLKIMKLTVSLGLYSSKAMGFYINHIEYEPMRKKVYHSWMLHRKIVPDLNKVTNIIKKENIRLLLFFGKYDIIIPPKLGELFAKRVGRPDALHILEIGHRLTEKHGEIAALIRLKGGTGGGYI